MSKIRLTERAKEKARIRQAIAAFVVAVSRDVATRAACGAGVLSSKYYPAVLDAFAYDTVPDLLFPTKWQFVLALIIGVVVAAKIDGKGDIEGQKRAWKRRWSVYFGAGFVSQTIVGGAVAAFGGG